MMGARHGLATAKPGREGIPPGFSTRGFDFPCFNTWSSFGAPFLRVGNNSPVFFSLHRSKFNHLWPSDTPLFKPNQFP
jgi:hypothetical protein